MDLRALLIIAPSFLFLCYLLELAYYKGLEKGKKKGRMHGIVEVKELLEDEAND